MGCQGRPLFDLNELPTEGDEESNGVLNLQPQRTRPSLNSHTTDLFAPSESGQRILNSHAFSHEPSVSGFQPFVRPKDAHTDGHVKQQASNHVNSNVHSSLRLVVHSEDNKTAPLVAPIPTQAVEMEKEEGEWSDVDGSADAFLRSPNNTEHERLNFGNCGMAEKVCVSSSDKAAESISRDIKHTEGPKNEVVNIAKDDIGTRSSFGFDSQPADWAQTSGRISDGSVKGDTLTDGREESLLGLKQRDVKGIDAIHALKAVNKLGKKHKLDHQKEAMLGKKRSRQTMFLNLEDIKQVGPMKSSTPKKQPVTSTLTSRVVKDIRTVPALAERSVERQGQHADISSNEGITTTEYGDHKSESNGDMNLGFQARFSRVNSVKDTSSEVCPPPIPRQGLWKQPTDLRQVKNPPLLPRKLDVSCQSSENSKPGNKKFPPVKKQSMNNTQYHDTSVERLLREVTNDKFWNHPEETELQCVPGRFESVEEYVRVFEPLLFEECRAQLYSTWEEQIESVQRVAHVAVRIRSVERRERG